MYSLLAAAETFIPLDINVSAVASMLSSSKIFANFFKS